MSIVSENSTKSEVDFLRLLQTLNYIEDGQIIDDLIIVQLNGNFSTRYKLDMQRIYAKEDFMNKFGDPLDGLDLSKKAVTFYPSYFAIRRIIFVFGSLYLWDRPLI